MAKNNRSGSKGRSRESAGAAHTTIDHEEIRQWVESEGGHPACVRGTGGGEDIGMLRIDFPGYSGETSLQEITWDEFFEKFDEQNLAFLYQSERKAGGNSRFNKLVSRDSMSGGRSSGRGRSSAGRSGAKSKSSRAGSSAKRSGSAGSSSKRSGSARSSGRASTGRSSSIARSSKASGGTSRAQKARAGAKGGRARAKSGGR